ncbi:MAG: diguanylate cyclase [Massilia sp.]|nr:diguanylate cyclase [Massilia sp.]
MPLTDERVLPSNLKIRLTGVVIVLVLAATVLVTMAALTLAERDMKGVIGDQQYAVVASAAAFIDERLEAKKQLMAALANGMPEAVRADPRRIQSYLETHSVLRTEFLNITAFGRDGRLVATLLKPASSQPISGVGKQYFEDTVSHKRSVISAPLNSALSGAPVVLMTVPLFDPKGDVALVLAGSIELRRSDFLRPIDLISPGQTGFVYVMTADGILVDHADRSRLMQHVNERPGVNRATKLALAGFEGWTEAANKEGADGIYSYKRLKSADWIVAARYPSDEAFAPLIKMRERAVLAAAAVALGAGLVAWLMIYRMLTPLETLHRNVSAIRANRAGISLLQGGSNDEIGELSGAFHDLMAEREAAQERTRGSERRARIIADNVPALIGYVNSEQRYEFANAHYLDMLGRDPAAMIGKTVREAMGERNYRLVEPRMNAALRGERQHFEQEFEFGRTVHYMVDYLPDQADNGSTVGAYILVTDISERKKAELSQASSEKRLKLITDNLPVLISYIDSEHNFRFGNATFDKWFGVAPVSLPGKSVAEVFGRDVYQVARLHLENAFGGWAVTFEARIAAGGKLRILETTYIPDVQADGSVAGVYALSHDMTRIKDVEEKLIQLARVDSLTDIANRRMFVEALHLSIERARRSGAPMALAYFDIDHFKQINDTHGHAVGDLVLKEFARRLQANVRATDTVARLSGDEFVIILEDLKTEQEVTTVAAKIVDAVRLPFEAAGVALTVTTSVGIALHSGAGQTHEELLANADSALYAAKRNGRDGVTVYGW